MEYDPLVPGRGLWGLAVVIALGQSMPPVEPVRACCRLGGDVASGGTGLAAKSALDRPLELEARRPKPDRGPGWSRSTDLQLLRLLVAISWADGAVAASEADRLFELARAVDTRMSRDAKLAIALEHQDAADDPDLAELGAHRARVLWEVETVIRIDGTRTEDEIRARDRVAAQLPRVAKQAAVD